VTGALQDHDHAWILGTRTFGKGLVQTVYPLDVKMTEGGRTVYGGGGITPDEKYEAPKMDGLELELGRSDVSNFTRWYCGSHSTSLPKGWMPDTAFLEQFHDYLVQHGTSFVESEFIQDRDWITRYLAREIYITAFNIDESDRRFTGAEMQTLRLRCRICRPVRLQGGARRTMPRAAGQKWRVPGPAV
jgi:carboxyl-terminal processing protease